MEKQKDIVMNTMYRWGGRGGVKKALNNLQLP